MIILERNGKVLSQAEMTSSSIILRPELLSLSDDVLIRFTRYLPPPATSQRVLRGDISIGMEELVSNDFRNCPYATGNNALELFVTAFSPKISSRSGTLFLASLPGVAETSSSAPSVELRIHVMDGLNYPLKQKTNLIVQFELLKYHFSPDLQTVKEDVISSIHTNHSLHPRQLVWDYKLSVPLSGPIIQDVVEAILPPPSRSQLSSRTGGDKAPPRYHMKVSLIQETEESSTPRTTAISSQQVQAMLVKDLSDILKPLILTNSSLLSAKSPPYSFSTNRHEIVLSLPFEPHLLLNTSSPATSDPCVRLRLGLLIFEPSNQSKDSSSRSQSKFRLLRKFDERSGVVSLVSPLLSYSGASRNTVSEFIIFKHVVTHNPN